MDYLGFESDKSSRGNVILTGRNTKQKVGLHLSTGEKFVKNIIFKILNSLFTLYSLD